MRRLAYCAALVGGAEDEAAHDVQLAVNEVLTNAARHAYPGTVGSIEIEIELKDGRFTVLVEDRGGPITGPIDVPSVRPGPGHPRGLYVVSRLMDEVEVTANGQGDGVAVKMSKILT